MSFTDKLKAKTKTNTRLSFTDRLKAKATGNKLLAEEARPYNIKELTGMTTQPIDKPNVSTDDDRYKSIIDTIEMGRNKLQASPEFQQADAEERARLVLSNKISNEDLAFKKQYENELRQRQFQEQSSGGKFIDLIGKTIRGEDTKDLTTGSKIADIGAGVIGAGLQLGMPTGQGSVVGLSNQIGRSVLASKLGSKVGSKVGRLAIEGATTTPGASLYQAGQEQLGVGDTAKKLAIESALGAGIGAGLGVAGKVVKESVTKGTKVISKAKDTKHSKLIDQVYDKYKKGIIEEPKPTTTKIEKTDVKPTKNAVPETKIPSSEELKVRVAKHNKLTEETLPNDVKALEQIVSEMEQAQKSGMVKVNLQLFAKVKEKLKKLKTSKFYKNTIQKSNILDDKDKAKIDKSLFAYEPTTEKVTLNKAKKFINEKGIDEAEQTLINKSKLTAEDTDASMMITEKYIQEARKTGDYSKVNDFLSKMRTKHTESGQSIQALAKWSRSPAGYLKKATDALEEGTTKRTKAKGKDTIKDIDRIRGQINEATKEVADKISKEIEGTEVHDVLARKIIKYTESRDIPQKRRDTVIAKVVNEMYKKFKDVAPSSIKNKTSRSKLLADAIKHRKISAEAWTKAKDVVRAKFSGDPEALKALDAYFEYGTKPPFADKTIMGAVSEGFKNIDNSMGKIVKDFYLSGKQSKDELVDYLIKKTQVSGEDARVLAKYVDNRFKQLRKEEAEKRLSAFFVEKNTSEVIASKSIKDIKEMINVGILKNNKYKDRAFTKIDPKLRAYFLKTLKEKGMSLSDLIMKGVKEAKFVKHEFSKNIVELLKTEEGLMRLSKQDIETLTSQFKNIYDDILYAKRSDMTKRLLNVTQKQKENPRIKSKILDLIQVGAYSDDALRDIIVKSKKAPLLTNELADVIVDKAEKLNSIPNTGLKNLIQREAIATDLMSTIAEATKPTVAKKIATFQVIQQLLNTVTSQRNIYGNEGYYRILRGSKYLESAVDWGVSKLTGADRTISFKKPIQSAFWSDFKKGAKAAWKGRALYGGSVDDKYMYNNKAFVGKWNPLNYMENTLGVTLRSPDYAAYVRGVSNAVGEMADLEAKRLKIDKSKYKEFVDTYANNITEDIFKIAEEVGKKNVFQNNTLFSIIGSGLKDWMNIIGIGRVTKNKAVLSSGWKVGVREFGVGDLVNKYGRTAGALLNAGMEFSPLGYLNSAYQLVRAYNMSPSIKQGLMQNRKQIIEATVRATTGSLGLSGLGYYLAGKGLVTPPDSEKTKERELKQAVGLRGYQINLSGIGRWVTSGFDDTQAKPQQGDKMYYYNWFQPLATPVNIGVAFRNRGLEKGLIEGTLLSVGEAMNTITEQSFMRGVQGLAKAYTYRGIYGVPEEVALQGITGFTSSFVNQIRKATDNIQRDTRADTFLKTLSNRIKNRIPTKSKELPEKVSTTGEIAKLYPGIDSYTTRLLSIFLNPGFLNTFKATPGVQLVLDLYSKSEDTDVLPRNVTTKQVTIGKEKIKLDPEQRKFLQTFIGTNTVKKLEELAKSSSFTKLSEEAQIERVKKFIALYGRQATTILKKGIMKNKKQEDVLKNE